MKAHGCNAYCADGLHCDLVYTEARATEGHIAQAYGYQLGVVVDRAIPAAEAPPLTAQSPESLDVLSGIRPSGERAWLVYWEALQ